MYQTRYGRALRDRVTIQEPVKTKDAHHQVTIAYNDVLTNIPVQFTYRTGSESERNDQVEANVDGIFRLRTTDVITVQHRVFWNGLCYGIVHIEPVENHYDPGYLWMDIHIKAAVE